MEAQLNTVFNDHFTANMGGSLPQAFSITEMDYDPDDNKVRAKVSYEYHHSFSKIGGSDNHDQSVETEIGLTTESKEPLSMILVLDKSGSMGWNNRMPTLKTAVAGMAQQLATADPDEKYVRMGVVFYNTSPTSLTMDWGTTTTNNLVQAVSPGGGTNSSGAMNTAVNHLFGDNESLQHSSKNNGNPRKVILFLTDGDNNHSSYDTATINECNRAKMNNNIEIYAIAFEAPPGGQALMGNCASSPDHYFNSQNSAELIAAFSEIAEISSGHLAFSK